MGTVDPEAAPPSYDSIFGELQAQKSQSSGVVDYAKNATGVCCGKVAGVVAIVIAVILFITLGLALPIAEIVIGSMYLYDCPAQRYLTIYLIVMGVFSIISGCTGGGSKAKSRQDSENENEEGGSGNAAGGCCNSLIGTFLFSWFVCGTVWVFRMDPCSEKVVPGCFVMNETWSGTASYCKPIVYNFVYWEIVAKWILIAALLVVTTFCCCVMCCVYCCTSKNEDTQ